MNGFGRFLLLGGLALGGMALVNRRVGEAYRPLPGSVDGEPGAYVWRDGVVYYHTKGEGEPMVLLHGFHHLSGAHEMEPVYNDLAADYRVTRPGLARLRTEQSSARGTDSRHLPAAPGRLP